MPIPDFQTLLLPILRHAASRAGEVYGRDCIRAMADEFMLTEAEREQRLPSGLQTRIANRVGWSITHLVKAMLLERTKSGFFQLSERGKLLLEENPTQLSNADLMRYPEFVKFIAPKNLNEEGRGQQEIQDYSAEQKTPDERIIAAQSEIEAILSSELIRLVHKSSPEFFEKLILDLLVAMGYGGGREDAAQHVGKTGDGGIDGLIKEDILGLDVVYLQAKRYHPDSSVGVAEVQGFSGSLIGRGATKGVFVTTSKFSSPASAFVAGNKQQKIVLIDGEALARHMIRYNIGVSVMRSILIKKIDIDYFEE